MIFGKLFLGGILSGLLLSSSALGGSAASRLRAESETAPVFHVQKGLTTPTLITGLSLTLPGADAASRARVFVDRYRDIFIPGDSLSEVRVRRVVRSPLGPVVQMEQAVSELAVYGKSLVVSLDNLQKVRMVVNGLSPLAGHKLFADLVSQPVAVSKVIAAFEAGGRTRRGEPRVETAWWPVDGRLEKMYLITVPGADPLGDFTYLVGGPRGNIGFVFQRTPMALGYAYPQNPLRGIYQQVELLHLTSATNLTGDNAQVYNCGPNNQPLSGTCNSPVQLATADGNGDFLIEPTGTNDPTLPGDLFVEVQAYYAINTIHDFFAALSMQSTPIKVGVNFPMSNDMGPNAYYSSREASMGNSPAIMMGQYQNIDLAVDNDVIFHEYGHHVFEQQSSTGLFEMDEYGPTFIGMGINEGTADYYSCSAMEDPSLGEYFASLIPRAFPEGYLRNVDNQLTCPDGLYGEAHGDGVVWSGFLWEVRKLVGKDQADTLYLDVIAHFPTAVTFPTVSQVYLQRAALALDAATVTQIQALLDSRGLSTCERFISLKSSGHTGLVLGRGMLGQYKNYVPILPAELHYYLEVPPNATQLKVSWTTGPYPGVDVVLLAREDLRITHKFGIPAGLQSQYDFMIEQGGGQFDLLNPDPNFPFKPGHTYYFHPCNRADPTTEYTISGEYTVVEQDGGVDGGADAGGDSGGDEIPADGGGDGAPECPDGFQPTFDGQQWLCVPICKEGYHPAKEGDTWVCARDSSGCGCGTGGFGAAPGLMLLLALGLLARRRHP